MEISGERRRVLVDINSVHVCGPFIHTLTFFPFFSLLGRRAHIASCALHGRLYDANVDWLLSRRLIVPYSPVTSSYIFCVFIYFFLSPFFLHASLDITQPKSLEYSRREIELFHILFWYNIGGYVKPTKSCITNATCTTWKIKSFLRSKQKIKLKKKQQMNYVYSFVV